VGSGIGYWIGAAGGKPLLLRYGKYLLIRRHDIEKTENWFQRHGKATIFFARLVPVIRHIISLPAGIARMPLRQFFLQTFLGATLWGSFLILLGYYLGQNWESVANKLKRFDLVIGVLIVVALLVLAIRFLAKRRRERNVAENNAD
jgi:membrane protein DedA with SNARE-associated domain